MDDQTLLTGNFTNLDPHNNDSNVNSLIFKQRMGSIVLGVVLSIFALVTILGNSLVVFAVLTKTFLQTPAGFLIVSLAVADLIVGTCVMPFNVSLQLTEDRWKFGLVFCDVWHSLDILASTSSIWNLCVISLDRFLAIRDPLSYRDFMTLKRIVIAICAVWVCSVVISFPAVAWWRAVSPELYVNPEMCLFTDDLAYVIFSSLISFYVPLIVILFAYSRVYVIAAKHGKSVQSGRKKISKRLNTPNASSDYPVYIRIHRGGGSNCSSAQLSRKDTCTNSTATFPRSKNSSALRPSPSPRASIKSSVSECPMRERGEVKGNEIETLESFQSFDDIRQRTPRARKITTTSLQRPTTNLLENVKYFTRRQHKRRCDINRSNVRLDENGRPRIVEGSHLLGSLTQDDFGQGAESPQGRLREVFVDAIPPTPAAARRVKRPKPRLFVKFMREKRAAKTLGIVVGCFLICWLPFFVINVLVVACRECLRNADLAFALTTWLGHCNSALNPFIYAVANREFRRAFKQILCQRYKKYSTVRGLGKATENVLKVMVVHFGRQGELNANCATEIDRANGRRPQSAAAFTVGNSDKNSSSS